MNKWLDKNYIDLVNTFERDYEVGVELCKENNVSALDYFNKLDESLCNDLEKLLAPFMKVSLRTKLKDTYYFLTLDRDIRGE